VYRELRPESNEHHTGKETGDDRRIHFLHKRVTVSGEKQIAANKVTMSGPDDESQHR